MRKDEDIFKMIHLACKCVSQCACVRSCVCAVRACERACVRACVCVCVNILVHSHTGLRTDRPNRYQHNLLFLDFCYPLNLPTCSWLALI